MVVASWCGAGVDAAYPGCLCPCVCVCLGRGVCVCHAAFLVWQGSYFSDPVQSFQRVVVTGKTLNAK